MRERLRERDKVRVRDKKRERECVFFSAKANAIQAPIEVFVCTTYYIQASMRILLSRTHTRTHTRIYTHFLTQTITLTFSHSFYFVARKSLRIS